jgi:hypothetical protein
MPPQINTNNPLNTVIQTSDRQNLLQEAIKNEFIISSLELSDRTINAIPFSLQAIDGFNSLEMENQAELTASAESSFSSEKLSANRLINLLNYLEQQQPNQGWLDYLDINSPKWEPIVNNDESSSLDQGAIAPQAMTSQLSTTSRLLSGGKIGSGLGGGTIGSGSGSSSTLKQYSILPQDTDSTINSSTNPHYVVLDQSVASNHKLFVFLPGTGAPPTGYRLITQQAAKLGYHAISLNYVNDQSISSICANSKDPNSYANVRLEILDGTDRTSLISVNRANSIENRLIKLLTYLNQQYPDQGWSEYLNGNSPKWNTITIAGHSQGGSEAAIIGKQYQVNRVAMFAAGPDGNPYIGGLAPWISAPGVTSSASYYGFVHEKDNIVGLTNELNMWKALGLNAYGSPVNVDGTQPPYNSSHQLTTAAAPAVAKQEHNSTVVDIYTPKLSDGTPLYAPTWQYLLGGTSGAATTAFKSSKPSIVAGTSNAEDDPLMGGSHQNALTKANTSMTVQLSLELATDKVSSSLAGMTNAASNLAFDLAHLMQPTNSQFAIDASTQPHLAGLAA